MKQKFVILGIGILLGLTACKSPHPSYTVEGDLQGLVNPSLLVLTPASFYTRIDTVIATKGKFSFTAESDSLQALVIFVEEENIWFTVWAANGDHVSIEGAVQSPEMLKIRGNAVNDSLTDFRQTNHKLIDDLRAAVADTVTAQNYKQQLTERIVQFIKNNPSSMASLVLMQDYLTAQEDIPLLQQQLQIIEDPAKASALYEQLQTYSRTVSPP
ncbi:MAG: DUF4369 domain-containing protein [Candidatus Symbiothrix sp.]|nr:DUF4369 domain-containing protein [Candidatus Symbiothrix sp.]